jgi:methylisocitrate lyase
MVKKIKSAVKAKKDKNFLIIARTDANAVEGLKKTINRIQAYVDAGADMIFPEAMRDEKEFEEVRKCTNAYLLANMTEFGKSKLLTTKELKNLGFNVVIYPVTTQRLAMKSVEDGLKTIFKDGHQKDLIEMMQTRKRLYELVDYEKYSEFDENIFKFSKKGHE